MRASTHVKRGGRPRLAAVVGTYKQPITADLVQLLSDSAAGFLDDHGQAKRVLAVELRRIESSCVFTRAARVAFQDLLARLGVDSGKPVEIPTSAQPYWFRYQHRLKEFRSSPHLPTQADVVIIGAGLTGASAAYHLREAASHGRHIVVLEKSFPGSEASGRNAGNFELLPENSVGIYEGLARERWLFLRRCYPWVPREILRLEAERQASLVLGFALRNRERIKQIIEKEKIDCDYCPAGWLYLAHTEREEKAIREEVALAAEQDQQIEIWSRRKIRDEFGFQTDYAGRFIPGDGTYHPFKFVYGLLEVATAHGVGLYTGVGVRNVNSEGKSHVVETDHGRVRCDNVIVATNAFTSRLFPELSGIRPAQSQISVTEFVPDRCRGRVVTSEEGPVYLNQPRGAANSGVAPLLLGGGADRPMRNPSSRRRSSKVHDKLVGLRARYFPEVAKRPFSTEWVGPIALTPDQLPAIGFLRSGIVIAAGFNGYGGSYCCAAGSAAADMALSGEVPDWLPEDVFSPKRLVIRQPGFLSDTDSVWLYASSLCSQLRGVDAEIADIVCRNAKRQGGVSFKTGSDWRSATKSVEVDKAALRKLRCFRGFTDDEREQLLSYAQALSARKGTVLFAAGGTGETCYSVVSGEVDLTLAAGGRQHHMARLGPGRIVGQVAFIEGRKRTATCVLRRDSVLLEFQRDACEGFFRSQPALAYKFLATLTEGLVDALRSANRHRARLSARGRASQAYPAGKKTRAKSAGA